MPTLIRSLVPPRGLDCLPLAQQTHPRPRLPPPPDRHQPEPEPRASAWLTSA